MFSADSDTTFDSAKEPSESQSSVPRVASAQQIRLHTARESSLEDGLTLCLCLLQKREPHQGKSESELQWTRGVVANFWQIFGKILLVFGCIGSDFCK